MGVRNMHELLQHPLCGASWEGFALEQVLRIAQPDQAYFWDTHQGAELELLMFKGPHRFPLGAQAQAVPLWTVLPQTARS